MQNLKKTLFFFLIIFAAICMIGCPDLFNPDGEEEGEGEGEGDIGTGGGGGTTPTAVTLNSVSANGTANTTTTTQLTLTFDKAITGLAANDITIAAGSTGAVRGALSGSGPTYYLAVSGVKAAGNVTVTVAKTGYTISGSSQQVTVHYKPSDGATVTNIEGFAVPSQTKATYNASYQGKNGVYKIEPSGTAYSDFVLSYSLAAYAGKEITITVTSDVWLATEGKVAWQASIGGSYPLIAGSYLDSRTASTWHSITGTADASIPAGGGTLYLSAQQLGTTTVIYITNLSVTITEKGGSGTGGGGGGHDLGDHHGTPAGWVDPATQNTKLTTVANTYNSNSSGNKNLPSPSPYGYELYLNKNGSGQIVGSGKLDWYGASQGGGGAFRAEWDNSATKENDFDFIARVGYFWGNGSTYPTYKNIYVDYNYTRDTRRQALGYSFIGVYGWSRNPSATNEAEKLIEYYIVDDWFGNYYTMDNTPVTTSTTGGEKIGEFTVDGALYHVVKNVRVQQPSIDGTKTFTQIFSIRQTLRTGTKAGTISVTEHYNKWEELGLTLGNLYECKFKVEAGGKPAAYTGSDFTGWLELSYLKLSQEELRR